LQCDADVCCNVITSTKADIHVEDIVKGRFLNP